MRSLAALGAEAGAGGLIKARAGLAAHATAVAAVVVAAAVRAGGGPWGAAVTAALG